MTYCEQTDFNTFSVHLSGEQLVALQAKLTGTTEPTLKILLNDICINRNPISKAGFERRRVIKLCPKCSGSGRIRVDSFHRFDFEYQDCPFCLGDGNIVESTVVFFERLTSSVKNEFAR